MKFMVYILGAAALLLMFTASFAGGDAEVQSLGYSPTIIAGGAEVYAEQCARCHGPELAGTERFAALTGESFESNWAGKTIGNLYSFISTEMPLGRGGTLSEEDYHLVTAFVLSHSNIGVEAEPGVYVALDFKTKLQFE